MRVHLFVAAMLLISGPAMAQTAPSANPYGLDPYKPSDAALLREYGVALVSQTPIQELAALDPYKPSHAALLRLGGALPVWAIGWPSVVAMLADPYRPMAAAQMPPTQRRARAMPETRVPVTEPAATAMATILRPESNDGVWIAFDGRRWILDGKIVEHEANAFERVGALDGHAVYRKSGEPDVVYVESGGRRLAPYRLKR